MYILSEQSLLEPGERRTFQVKGRGSEAEGNSTLAKKEGRKAQYCHSLALPVLTHDH